MSEREILKAMKSAEQAIMGLRDEVLIARTERDVARAEIERLRKELNIERELRRHEVSK